MRALWTTIALMGENKILTSGQTFNQSLDLLAQQRRIDWFLPAAALTSGDRHLLLNLQLQPLLRSLDDIGALLRTNGPGGSLLILSAYEVAEVNRLTVEGRPNHASITSYWKGLNGALAHSSDPEFMAAVGALAVDTYLLDAFSGSPTVQAAGNYLRHWFPALADAQVDLLWSSLQTGSPAYQAAKVYAAASWNPMCASAADAHNPTWFHLNL